MAVSVNTGRFARDLRVALDRNTLWPEAQKRIAQEARAFRDRLIASGEFPPKFKTSVNGVPGAREESIEPHGLIRYSALLLGDAAALALRELRKRAPRSASNAPRDGVAYADSFRVSVDGGYPLQWHRFDPAKVSPEASEVWVFSPLPYSRKLDVQIAGGRKLEVNADPGFFSDAAAAVRSAFPMLHAQRVKTLDFPEKERRVGGGEIEYPAVLITTEAPAAPTGRRRRRSAWRRT